MLVIVKRRHNENGQLSFILINYSRLRYLQHARKTEIKCKDDPRSY